MDLFYKESIIDYKSMLKDCFVTDPNLLEKWHIASGQGLDACVDKTFQDLQYCKASIYKLTSESDLVGYFGKELCDDKQWLTGFFLFPKFRNEQNKKEFWQIVESEFQRPYFCGLYEKNKPANAFIKKHGGELIKSVDLSNGPVLVYRIGV